ncbi:phosphatase 2C-like domain-containing protein [Sparassis latifolia]|uniref:protein-serine/threonine phosphatase n=1 Tax=Sparassis crispa TaxID=139825 RepID=A0A401GRQ8_9APHY|nr:Protein phosphatase 2C homolog 2 [Sparassis crispa]GBE84931.1 Protein phosphatase 2C homolog 2 [Sparassis crispa]
MGQTLSTPVTQKKTEDGGNDKFYYAVSEMQGWRIEMEDAHTIALSLDQDDDESNTFFAVYDGHGGASVAKYAGEHVHKKLLADGAYLKKEYATALKNAFLGTDADMRASSTFTRDTSGCTAVAALVTSDERIYVANAGDSRSVISVKGEAKPLSYDHKPQNEIERSRILAAGGYIEFGRVNGNLALARALGDFEYKKNASLAPEKQIITSDPEVIAHEITDEDEFLVIACDGIWDCLTSQQAVNVIRLLIARGKTIPEICEEICELCLAPDTDGRGGIGCDNMTILIVAILHGRTLQEWYGWVTNRVKHKHGFATPDQIPQLYSTSALIAFRARREAYEARQREREAYRNASSTRPDTQGFGGNTIDGVEVGGSSFRDFARILGSTGGITYNPATGELKRRLVFDDVDVDDDDDDSGDEYVDADETNGVTSFTGVSFNGTFGLPHSDGSDITKSLREQLDELEEAEADSACPESDDMQMGEIDDEVTISGMETAPPTAATPAKQQDSGGLQGEAPPPPKLLQNGDARPKQLVSSPAGDAPSAAVQAEGFLDSSESPLKL